MEAVFILLPLIITILAIIFVFLFSRFVRSVGRIAREMEQQRLLQEKKLVLLRLSKEKK